MNEIISCTIIVQGRYRLFLNDRPVGWLGEWLYRRYGRRPGHGTVVDIDGETKVDQVNLLSRRFKLIEFGQYAVAVDIERARSAHTALREHFISDPLSMFDKREGPYVGIWHRAGSHHRHLPLRVIALMIYFGYWQAGKGKIRLSTV